MSRRTTEWPGASALLRAPLLAVAVTLVTACGGGDRPNGLPDEPRIALSKDHLAFEMNAYQPSTLTPTIESIRITNPSSTPLEGFPNRIDITYLAGGANWLAPEFRVDNPGYRVDVRLANIDAMDEGVYQAKLSVVWPGAANSPAVILVDLVVHQSTAIWRQGPSQVVPYRFGHAAVALPGGGALLIGGRNVPPYTSPAASIERLDPDSATLSSVGGLRRGRDSHTATLLADGTVFVAGGLSDDAALPPSRHWELHGGHGELLAEGSLVQARYNHTAVLLGDGRVLLIGGAVQTTVGNQTVGDPTRRCEIFDPRTRQTTEVDPIVGASAVEGTSVLLPDGRVLITDLDASGNAVGTEIFDPSAAAGAKWKAVRSRQQLRAAHGLAALPGGKVIAFGGLAGTSMTAVLTAEVYDPVENSWAYTGSLHVAHVLVGESSVALSSGRVLVAGGLLRMGTDAASLFPTAAVETYDPTTGTWTISSALSAPRAMETVTVLADGTVMAAGGYPNAQNVVEFWKE